MLISDPETSGLMLVDSLYYIIQAYFYKWLVCGRLLLFRSIENKVYRPNCFFASRRIKKIISEKKVPIGIYQIVKIEIISPNK